MPCIPFVGNYKSLRVRDHQGELVGGLVAAAQGEEAGPREQLLFRDSGAADAIIFTS